MSESSVSGDSSSSKSLLWMMVALFAGLGILMAGGLFMARRVVRSIGLTASAPKDTIRTPGATFRLEKENQIGPGLPVYPGAALVLPGDDALAEATKDASTGRRIAVYQTESVRDLVDSWYQGRLSAEYVRHDAGESPEAGLLVQAGVPGSDLAFVAQRGSQIRIVALTQSPTGTRIALIQFDQAPEN